MATRLLLRDERRLEVGRERIHARALEGDLDVLAVAALIADAERGEHGGEDVERGRVVALTGATERRRRGRLTEQTHDPRPRPERGVVESRPALIGAAPAVAAERRIDDARVHGAHLFPREPVADAARLDEVGEQHVDVRAEPAHQLRSARPIERDRHRALAAVVALERVVLLEGLAVAHRRHPVAAEHVTLGGLDLDHVGAEIGHERAGRGRGEPIGDFEDTDARERSEGLT